jgi:hypothetical protein
MPTKAKKATPVVASSAPQAETPAAAAVKAPARVRTTAVANEPGQAKTALSGKADKAEVDPSAKKKISPKRPKLVRDSFTFPVDDYARIAELKERLLGLGREVKKSELLRAGLNVLSSLTNQTLLGVVDALVKIKTGRPGKK